LWKAHIYKSVMYMPSISRERAFAFQNSANKSKARIKNRHRKSDKRNPVRYNSGGFEYTENWYYRGKYLSRGVQTAETRRGMIISLRENDTLPAAKW
jgi:hypothetical protein